MDLKYKSSLIDVEDLHIGNWFHHEKHVSERNPNGQNEFDFKWTSQDYIAWVGNRFNIETCLSPIELTDFWVNCIYEEPELNLYKFNITPAKDKYWNLRDGKKIMARVRYVHELQTVLRGL